MDKQSRMQIFPYPTLLRRCRKATIQLRLITIPLADSFVKSSRKSSACDSRPGRDVHTTAADRGIKWYPGTLK
ncbi:hypothetical protein DPMN_002007 [Dreissena polymorpha]|uniref:Uncharacterized protein n=1 Tax=Dreissena polymorpha TaxID=45954 RepID=A0A9D4MKF9_DREPO|nr:hypothetical protein DPMN_002007 [Dreissena polymorpha]